MAVNPSCPSHYHTLAQLTTLQHDEVSAVKILAAAAGLGVGAGVVEVRRRCPGTQGCGGDKPRSPRGIAVDCRRYGEDSSVSCRMSSDSDKLVSCGPWMKVSCQPILECWSSKCIASCRVVMRLFLFRFLHGRPPTWADDPASHVDLNLEARIAQLRPSI